MFSNQLPKLNGSSFRVKIRPGSSKATPDLCELLSDSVVSYSNQPCASVSLEPKFFKDDTLSGSGDFFMQRSFQLLHSLPAMKKLLPMALEALLGGLRGLEVDFELLGGASNDIVLHTLKFTNVDLQATGDLVLGTPSTVHVKSIGTATNKLKNVVVDGTIRSFELA